MCAYVFQKPSPFPLSPFPHFPSSSYFCPPPSPFLIYLPLLPLPSPLPPSLSNNPPLTSPLPLALPSPYLSPPPSPLPHLTFLALPLPCPLSPSTFNISPLTSPLPSYPFLIFFLFLPLPSPLTHLSSPPPAHFLPLLSLPHSSGSLYFCHHSLHCPPIPPPHPFLLSSPPTRSTLIPSPPPPTPPTFLNHPDRTMLCTVDIWLG